MNRAEAVARLSAGGTWDIAIIGGGATGLSSALDAAARGYKVALVERDDFAQATSSRSTKLLHGGVRYLRQGRLSLVRGALQERDRLLRNAPDLATTRDFIVPVYSSSEKIYYGIGLKAYDLLARGSGTPASRVLSREETLAALPGLREEGLTGGVSYVDGQFDDAGLAIAIAQAAWKQGATVANHLAVTGLMKAGGRVCGVECRDAESGRTWDIGARVVINATGAFADDVRRLDDRSSPRLIAPSQGAHIVLPRRFLSGDAAILVPKTDDGRVLFAIPWHDRVLLGTTDTPLEATKRDPLPLAAEIEFLLGHAGKYLREAPQPGEVLSAFAGIRPLVKARGNSTSSLSRDHVIAVSNAGLVTITGGKWTTCRQMAEDVVNQAARLAGLPARPCVTAELAIPASPRSPRPPGRLLHPDLPYTENDLLDGIEHGMARTVEDLLARRTRALYLDARASASLAPLAAAFLSPDPQWQAAQVSHFQSLASNHLVSVPNRPVQ